MSNDNPIVYRSGTLADVDAVLDLWSRGAYHASSTDNAEALTSLIEGWPDALVLALDGDEVVGSIIWGFDGWRGILHRLAVDPAHRRRHIARDLVAEAHRRLAAAGATRVYALVETENPLAVSFWDASDYETTDLVHAYFGRVPANER